MIIDSHCHINPFFKKGVGSIEHLYSLAYKKNIKKIFLIPQLIKIKFKFKNVDPYFNTNLELIKIINSNKKFKKLFIPFLILPPNHDLAKKSMNFYKDKFLKILPSPQQADGVFG